MISLTDDLWKKAKNGDKIAEDKIFGELTERFITFIRFKIGGTDAEDIAQEACIKVLRNYKQLGPPYNYNAWAVQVVRNEIRDYLRQKLTRNKFKDYKMYLIEYYSRVGFGDSIEVLDALSFCIRKLIKGFPRYIRVMNYVQQGYDRDDICSKLNITASNLYVILSRGRKLLNECLKKDQ